MVPQFAMQVRHTTEGGGIMGIFKDIEDRVEKGMQLGTELLYEASRAIVPVDTAELLLSAKKLVTREASRKTVTGQVWYTAPHAAVVHESTWIKHSTGKSAKYLEKPARILAVPIRNLIEKEVQR
jgi:hypothetical protein